MREIAAIGTKLTLGCRFRRPEVFEVNIGVLLHVVQLLSAEQKMDAPCFRSRFDNSR